VSPEPELRSRETPRKGSLESRSARVKRELLAETNGPYTTSELSYFLDRLLVVGPYEEIFCAVVSAHLFFTDSLLTIHFIGGFWGTGQDSHLHLRGWPRPTRAVFHYTTGPPPGGKVVEVNPYK